MSIQLAIFSIFAIVTIGSALMVVTSNNPVRSALFLVLAFLASAGIWILAQAEFLALILVLVYVGAVMTLFLFVIMMLNIDVAELKSSLVRYLPLGLLIVGLLIGLMIMAINPEHFDHIQSQAAGITGLTNTQALGSLLYTYYAFNLEMAAVLLLVAIIAAITLTHRPPRNCKTQKPVEQMKVRREDRVRLVKMKTEK